jgi:hypothetical protein
MSNAFELLIGSLGAIACWVLWFYFAKEQRVDAFREELFSIRKDLFLMAASGEISFESKSYTELRYLINGMLQFAHRISLPTSLVAARLAEINPDKTNIYDQWKRSLDGAPAEVRAKLDSIHSRMFRAYMNQLVHGSVVLSVVAFALIALAAIKFFGASLFTEKRRVRFDLVDIAVNNIANSVHAQALEEQAYRDQSDHKDFLPA